MDMRAFCTEIMARARFRDEEEAERTAIESVAVLARSLPHALAMEVAERIPDQLGETMRIAAGGGEVSDPTGSDVGPDTGMPEDWPAITPDEPFDWEYGASYPTEKACTTRIRRKSRLKRHMEIQSWTHRTSLGRLST